VQVVPTLLKDLWKQCGFNPNPEQKAAILHMEGPLFLPAGPGSGKTRVLLWRSVNLMAVHGIAPEELFLSTFTEKAARQLRDGIRSLMASVGKKTGQPFDPSGLYVGTVHSLCQRLLRDRRFSSRRSRTLPPVLMDEFDQYLFLLDHSLWRSIKRETDPYPVSHLDVLKLFKQHGSSRDRALESLRSFFNRVSEERLDTAKGRKQAKDPTLKKLLGVYDEYVASLKSSRDGETGRTDFSLLQGAALDRLQEVPHSHSVFKHIMVDEYQDTNSVQETIFFHLARATKNLCVVGDDDQALYRFRGATVENFVSFPKRCRERFGKMPTQIVLGTNYRSKPPIVKFFSEFMQHPSCNWAGTNGECYRVADKKIVPARKEKGVAVLATLPESKDAVTAEIVQLVKRLLDKKRVADPNQIAFLFPSLKTEKVKLFREALEGIGLRVYAPRAGTFLKIPEVQAVLGLILHILGGESRAQLTEFVGWLTLLDEEVQERLTRDRALQTFVRKKQEELHSATSDAKLLWESLSEKGLTKESPYCPEKDGVFLMGLQDLSKRAKQSLKNKNFYETARSRLKNGRPFSMGYVVARVTSLDWNLLDLFYEITGLPVFRRVFELAEKGEDEGPVCHLGMLSQYLARFMAKQPRLFANIGQDSGSPRHKFEWFLQAIFRKEMPEYEDQENPFPRGRIPFLTIHQAKGLEFPVVVLGNCIKQLKPQGLEEVVAPLVERKGEPPERQPLFDAMRLFYVALSRAKNLLVLPRFEGKGTHQTLSPFKDILQSLPVLDNFNLDSLPVEKEDVESFPENFSYTGDYLLYRQCPRQYPFFRKYGFAPSRSQVMFFGSLVHQTIEDLHQELIYKREAKK